MVSDDAMFGHSVAVFGDINGDGIADISISANRDDDSIGDDVGKKQELQKFEFLFLNIRLSRLLHPHGHFLERP